MTDDAILNISEAEAKGNSGKLTGWPLRVALAQACMLLYRVDAALLAPDVLAAALQLTQGLLSDRSYAARLAGGRLVQARACPRVQLEGGLGGRQPCMCCAGTCLSCRCALPQLSPPA